MNNDRRLLSRHRGLRLALGAQPEPSPVFARIAPSEVALEWPADHYRHSGAPTEWWWLIGTLTADDGSETYGFEVDAYGGSTDSGEPVGLTYLAVTAVNGQSSLRGIEGFVGPAVDDWAESDPSKPWRVELGRVHMSAPSSNPTEIHLKVDPTDQAPQQVGFDLTLRQVGAPMPVFGIGVHPAQPPYSLNHHNWYYSLTRLQTSGTLYLVDGQQIPVSGTTWMDHQWGWFGNSGDAVKWLLQDIQLDNSVTLSNFQVLGGDVATGARPSQATVQRADGSTYFVNSTVTPTGRTWTSPVTGKTYFMEVQVQVPDFSADLLVTSLYDDQEFYFPNTGQPDPRLTVYEGVAKATGTFEGQPVVGTAWMEQTPAS